MIADMVEFSRRMEQDEVGSADQVTRSIQLFRGLIGDYGGRVANMAGDGILALFDSAGQALRFAIQIQTEFRDQSVWGDGEPIQFRIGLNIGEVTFHESIAYGHCINVAARLQAMADPAASSSPARSARHGRRAGHVAAFGGPAAPEEYFRADRRVRGRAIGREAVAARRRAPRPPLAEPVRHPTIAVLPLTNLSGDPRNDHLCEGIAEDIIASLAPVPQPDGDRAALGVPVQPERQSRPEVQNRLGVRYILAEACAGRTSAFASPSSSSTRRTETALWSDRFNLELEDLFDLQDEIAGAVASRLSIQIDIAERRQESPHPRDMRAYGLVVRGRHLILKFTKEANWHARRLFEEAIEYRARIRPRAFSALSRTHNLDWRYAWSSTPQESLESAIVLARRAKEFDRLDAQRLRRARLRQALPQAARRSARRILRRPWRSTRTTATSSSNTPTRSSTPSSRSDRSSWCKRRCGSIPIILIGTSGTWRTSTMRWAASEDVVATVMRMHDPSEGQRLLAVNYSHLGMMREAQAAAREVIRLHPQFTIAQWRERPPYRDPLVLERYVEGLRKAGLPE